MYENGFGVAQDRGEAVKWCTLAAQQAFPVACSTLAGYHEQLCVQGVGQARDRQAAVALYSRALKGGFAQAKDALARMGVGGGGAGGE